jgi:hypothetical protein
MVGKPDGLGVLAGRINNGTIEGTDQYLTVLMNHELPDAFVSQWTFDLETLKVVDGRDLVTRVFTYANGNWTDSTNSATFNRLCSANLPPTSALYNSSTGKGFNGRLYMNGEETGEGRAFAHVLTGSEYGTSYQLASLGRYAYETVVANPNSGDTTLAIGLDDANPGEVFVYVGTKSSAGNPAEMAGFVGGKLYGIKVTDGGANYSNGAVVRENSGAIEGSFTLVDLSDVATGTGAALQTTAENRGVTGFARPEGGFWDTSASNAFYFAVTGASLDGHVQSARIYKLTFDSITNPTSGTIDLVVDSASLAGKDGLTARHFDNVTVDGAGRVIVDEDTQDAPNYAGKIWMIDPGTGNATQLFESDRSRFVTGGSNFLVENEENSGVNEITDAVRNASWFDSSRRYYIGDLQAHYDLASPVVEGGQLYLFASP